MLFITIFLCLIQLGALISGVTDVALGEVRTLKTEKKKVEARVTELESELATLKKSSEEKESETLFTLKEPGPKMLRKR